MAHSASIRFSVREAYISGLSLPAVAKRFGISETTVRHWKLREGESWDRAQAAKSMVMGVRGEAVQQILGDFLQVHSEAIRVVRDSDLPADKRVELLASLTDSLTKTMSALGRAAPQISEFGVALEVLQELGDFIKRHHPRLVLSFMEVLEPFGAQLAKKYG